MFHSKLFGLIVLVIAIVLNVESVEENYCDPSLCDDGISHIACDHYLEFAQDCGDEPELIAFGAKEKKFILDIHNHHRERIAAGKLPGYAPAVRMPVLRWNDDLAYIAGLHVRACSTDNDKCRNTLNFRNSGQNVGLQLIEGNVHNVTGIIKTLIDGWIHNEYHHGNQNNVKTATEEDIILMGRFFLMANDHVSDIGCAMIKYDQDDVTNVLFTCNYGSNTHPDHRVYEAGTPCSKCLTGCHRIYPSLCSPEERVNPNPNIVKPIADY